MLRVWQSGYLTGALMFTGITGNACLTFTTSASPWRMLFVVLLVCGVASAIKTKPAKGTV